MPTGSELRAGAGTARAVPARRVLAAAAALLALAAGAADLARPAEHQAAVAVARLGVRAHRATLGRCLPLLGIECRFHPTCSHYADAVLGTHGALAGSALTVRRLARCGPWTAAGTPDPPPEARLARGAGGDR